MFLFTSTTGEGVLESLDKEVFMRPETEKLLAEALQLPPQARAALAGQLIESLDKEVDEDAEAAWSAEIARRVKELETGRVKAVPWSEARRQILELPRESSGA